MAMQKCAYGHLYDNKTYEKCPYCENQENYYEYQQYYLKNNTRIADKYRIKKVLGKGGTGIVYKAEDANGKKYAIKEFFPPDISYRSANGLVVTSDNELFDIKKKMFLQELNTLKELKDIEEVITVYDIIEMNNTIYAVLEFIEGISLREFYELYREDIPYNITKEIVYSVLYGLNNIHKKGFLVLDISGDNVFLDKQGRIIYIDFGTYAITQSNVQMYKNSEAAFTITVRAEYASPESYTRDIGQYTDIYASAVLFCKIIFNINVENSVTRLINDNISIKSDLIDLKTRRALDKALKLNYKERTQTAIEFIEDLFQYHGESLKKPNTDLLKSCQQIYDSRFQHTVPFMPQFIIGKMRSSERDLSTTAALKEIGIDFDKIPEVDLDEIRNERQAYNMLLNRFKMLDAEYVKSQKQVKKLENKLEDKKHALIFMTVAEIVLSFGMTFITELSAPAIMTVIAGLFLTGYSLYINLKE